MGAMGAKNMREILPILAATILGCSSVPTQPAAPPPDPSDPEAAPPRVSVADAELGLSKTSVTDVPDPPEFSFPTTEPGESRLLARSFSGAPPLIPHDVEAFLPITREENNCLACHDVGPASEDGPPAIPSSHATDLRAAPDEVTGAVIGARWRCVACHVPQAQVSPLVQSTFSQ